MKAQPGDKRLPAKCEEDQEERQHDDVPPRADAHGKGWSGGRDERAQQSDGGQRLTSPAEGCDHSESQRDCRSHEKQSFESGGVPTVASAVNERKAKLPALQ